MTMVQSSLSPLLIFILGFGEINKRKVVIGGEDFTVEALQMPQEIEKVFILRN